MLTLDLLYSHFSQYTIATYEASRKKPCLLRNGAQSARVADSAVGLGVSNFIPFFATRECQNAKIELAPQTQHGKNPKL